MNVFIQGWKTVQISFWNIVLFEVLMKLCALLLVIPIFSILITSFQFPTLLGFGLFLTLIVFFTSAVLLMLLVYGEKKYRVSIGWAIRSAFSIVGHLIPYAILVYGWYVMTLLILSLLGGTSFFLPFMTIPPFIMNDLLHSGGGLLVFIIAYLVLFFLMIRYVFVFPMIVLDRKTFWQATRESSILVKKNRKILFKKGLSILFFMLFIFVFIKSISFFSYWLTTLTEQKLWSSLAISVQAQLVYAGSFLLTPFYLAILIHLYREISGVPTVVQDDITRKEKRWSPFFHKHVYKLMIAYLLVIITITGYVSSISGPLPDDNDRPIIMAHRGYLGVENTIEAIQNSIDAKAEYVEIDVMQTKDKELVVIHDNHLERLAGVDLHVHEATLEELQQLTLSVGSFTGKISTLKEVIQYAKGKIKLNIEIKLHGHEDKEAVVTRLIQLINENELQQVSIIQSSHHTIVRKIKNADPNLQVGYITFASQTKLKELPGDFFVVEEYSLKPSQLVEAKKLNKPVYVWTVNLPDQAYLLSNMGVDAIITDYPPLVYLAHHDKLEENIRYNPFQITTKIAKSIQTWLFL
ncbi:glycerophosphodiester phosphodiesterase [Brevibacillus daliensis]|uniref:glycerophosphodiester phosphodiesterase n=1 Tax=Brevibacillus daliensis TaxID=2892995 RepID=UPI001E5B789B|nr:glycerophosphodiester phosphodiesterase [Brevibacillus daliensis]